MNHMIDEDRLLFRAWSGGKMIHFGKGCIDFVTTDEDTIQAGLFFPMISEKFSITGAIVMQYTGLWDVFGTRIFDGDILQRGIGVECEYIGVVKWENDGWIFSIPEPFQYDIFTGFTLSQLLQHPVQVVGNIFENPELLKSIN